MRRRGVVDWNAGIARRGQKCEIHPPNLNDAGERVRTLYKSIGRICAGKMN
jgi:hypothetical protein